MRILVCDNITTSEKLITEWPPYIKSYEKSRKSKYLLPQFSHIACHRTKSLLTHCGLDICSANAHTLRCGASQKFWNIIIYPRKPPKISLWLFSSKFFFQVSIHCDHTLIYLPKLLDLHVGENLLLYLKPSILDSPWVIPHKCWIIMKVILSAKLI